MTNAEHLFDLPEGYDVHAAARVGGRLTAIVAARGRVQDTAPWSAALWREHEGLSLPFGSKSLLASASGVGPNGAMLGLVFRPARGAPAVDAVSAELWCLGTGGLERIAERVPVASSILLGNVQDVWYLHGRGEKGDELLRIEGTSVAVASRAETASFSRGPYRMGEYLAFGMSAGPLLVLDRAGVRYTVCLPPTSCVSAPLTVTQGNPSFICSEPLSRANARLVTVSRHDGTLLSERAIDAPDRGWQAIDARHAARNDVDDGLVVLDIRHGAQLSVGPRALDVRVGSGRAVWTTERDLWSWSADVGAMHIGTMASPFRTDPGFFSGGRNLAVIDDEVLWAEGERVCRRPLPPVAAIADDTEGVVPGQAWQPRWRRAPLRGGLAELVDAIEKGQTLRIVEELGRHPDLAMVLTDVELATVARSWDGSIERLTAIIRRARAVTFDASFRCPRCTRPTLQVVHTEVLHGNLATPAADTEVSHRYRCASCGEELSRSV